MLKNKILLTFYTLLVYLLLTKSLLTASNNYNVRDPFANTKENTLKNSQSKIELVGIVKSKDICAAILKKGNIQETILLGEDAFGFTLQKINTNSVELLNKKNGNKLLVNF